MIKMNAPASSPVSVTISAIKTKPLRRDIFEALALYTLFLILSGYVGFSSGLFKFSLTQEWPLFITVAVIAFVIPALFEEIVFRVGLPALLKNQCWADVMALTVFIAWHPAQVWFGLPMGQDTFLHPAFLIIVASLGAICTISYRRSGSIWPAVAMHWMTVLIWKGMLAG